MNVVDRQAIEDLFTRLKDAEKNGGPRDPEAEELIGRLVARQSAAAYYLAQTVLVQQWALNNARDRIEALERSGGGGLFSALFGGGRSLPQPQATDRPAPASPHDARNGFLAGATQTALGVAGGFILADMLSHGNFVDSSFASGLEAPSPGDSGSGGDFGGGDFGSGDLGGGDFGGG
jgi:hypothetical protein